MAPNKEITAPERVSAGPEGGLLALGLLALLVGAGSGLVGAVFRLCLERADHLRNVLVGHGAW
jgi:CIC family chloride channel protein